MPITKNMGNQKFIYLYGMQSFNEFSGLILFSWL